MSTLFENVAGFGGPMAVAGEGAAAGREAAAAALDQKRENRGEVVGFEVPEGSLLLKPLRSGGPFDPLGCRQSDVFRADDVVALVEAFRGRWVMIALTVDREAFVGPEAAYQACNDRVREVARAVSLKGVHVTALELQGKTGSGWPHWHLVVWCPDGRSIDDIKRAVLKAWRTRHESIDAETGEVSVSMMPIGAPQCQDVQEAKTREGIARYCGKYLVKAWPAIPTWMGESRRQLRKLRPSLVCFDWWERVGRHERHRGSRRVAGRRRGRARVLFDRMARSGTRMAALRMVKGRMVFERTVPVVADQAGFERLVQAGGEVVRLGKWASMRVVISEGALSAMLRRSGADLERRVREVVAQRRGELETEWDRMQSWRARGGRGDAAI